MYRSLSRKRRFGFTLVEVLVTTVVIGVLAAVVLPALVRQTTAADPARVASDLNNLKMGIEVFSQNVRPDFPGDLEDLVNTLVNANSTTTDDLAFDGSVYPNFSKWKGPYVAQTLAAVTNGSGSTPWRAGSSGFFENDLKECYIDLAATCLNTGGASSFVTVQINGLTATEAANIDVVIDGSASGTAGLFRYETSATPAYYYALPYTP